MCKISENEFEEKYKPLKNHIDDNASFDGCMFETYDEEVDYVFEADARNVWTYIEADGVHLLAAGRHLINRLGYLITEVPWETGTEEVPLD